MIRDVELLNRIDWNVMVCDEAQAIKNYESQRSIAVRKIHSNSRIAVSGTPFENRLTDIWSLFDFIVPGLLGGVEYFNKNYPNSISGAQKLEPIISPLILRRLVKDVADDLPERIDIPEVISMNDFLEDLYDQQRNEIIAEYGPQASLIQIQSLRMMCCDPSLVLKDGIDYSTRNPKLQRLIELVSEIFANGEKVLVFTSYTAMADLILSLLLDQFGCYVRTIDGRTPVPQRQEIIDEFSKTAGKAALVLNPRAAGAGLNITAANHVIHYNLEWNPAIEDQASARAHRRGQTLPVFIRRLYYAGSVEEFVNSKIEEKRALSNAAVEGVGGLTEDFMNIYEALQYTPRIKNI
jgi:SNF2 family DNA or RNA helicase